MCDTPALYKLHSLALFRSKVVMGEVVSVLGLQMMRGRQPCRRFLSAGMHLRRLCTDSRADGLTRLLLSATTRREGVRERTNTNFSMFDRPHPRVCLASALVLLLWRGQPQKIIPGVCVCVCGCMICYVERKGWCVGRHRRLPGEGKEDSWSHLLA